MKENLAAFNANKVLDIFKSTQMSLEAIFKIQTKVREGVYYNLTSLPLNKLISIPQGFSNNILWNAGHIISVQQSLVYELTGNKVTIDQAMLSKFQQGSFPDFESVSEDFEWIKENICNSLEKSKADYDHGLFMNVPTPYITMLSNEVTAVEDCFQMALFHDSIHFDRIRAFKRLLA